MASSACGQQLLPGWGKLWMDFPPEACPQLVPVLSTGHTTSSVAKVSGRGVSAFRRAMRVRRRPVRGMCRVGSANGRGRLRRLERAGGSGASRRPRLASQSRLELAGAPVHVPVRRPWMEAASAPARRADSTPPAHPSKRWTDAATCCTARPSPASGHRAVDPAPAAPGWRRRCPAASRRFLAVRGRTIPGRTGDGDGGATCTPGGSHDRARRFRNKRQRLGP